MPIRYCRLCERSVEARRQIGVGPLLLAIVTGRLWLLCIPFYARRCPICKSLAVTTTHPNP
jgi:hypothetical protein